MNVEDVLIGYPCYLFGETRGSFQSNHHPRKHLQLSPCEPLSLHPSVACSALIFNLINLVRYVVRIYIIYTHIKEQGKSTETWRWTLDMIKCKSPCLMGLLSTKRHIPIDWFATLYIYFRKGISAPSEIGISCYDYLTNYTYTLHKQHVVSWFVLCLWLTDSTQRNHSRPARPWSHNHDHNYHFYHYVNESLSNLID